MGRAVAVTPWTPGARREERRASATPWRAVEYVVIDLETTGLDPRRDEILSFGHVTVRDARVLGGTADEGFVRPRREIPAASIKIHAMRRDDLRAAPSLEHAVTALTAALHGRVLVAHASWIERAFLTRAFARYRCRLESPVVDTAALARALGWAPQHADREPSLEWLCASRDLPVHTPHQALGDAMSTAGLFLAQCAHLSAGAGPEPSLTLGDLLRLTRLNALR